MASDNRQKLIGEKFFQAPVKPNKDFMFNISFEQATASSERPARKKFALFAVGALLIFVIGIIFASWSVHPFDVKLSSSKALGRRGGDDEVSSSQITLVKTAHSGNSKATNVSSAKLNTIDRLVCYVAANPLKVAGVSFMIVAVLAGMIVFAILLSCNNEKSDIVDASGSTNITFDLEPNAASDIESANPQPPLIPEEQPGMSVPSMIGIVLGSVLSLIVLVRGGVAFCSFKHPEQPLLDNTFQSFRNDQATLGNVTEFKVSRNGDSNVEGGGFQIEWKYQGQYLPFMQIQCTEGLERGMEYQLLPEGINLEKDLIGVFKMHSGTYSPLEPSPPTRQFVYLPEHLIPEDVTLFLWTKPLGAVDYDKTNRQVNIKFIRCEGSDLEKGS